MDNLSRQTSQSIQRELDILARNAVDRQYALQAELWEPYNLTGYAKSIRDAGYHFSFLAEALAVNASPLFLDYVAWVKVLFIGLKFPPGVLTTALECTKQAIEEILQPDQALLASSYIDAALDDLPNMPDTLDSFLSPDNPLYELAVQYLNALLGGDRYAGSQLIRNAAARGVGVKDIYNHVFHPCQLEIGRLWQMNRISVAQEHFCTNATQMIMSQLYPYIYTTLRNGRCVVATSVGGESHEIGIRMVADFFEMEGWDTYYLGANTPAESILSILDKQNADILAISSTLSLHVSKVADLIQLLRSSSIHPKVKILVGGSPFNIARDLWQQVGADGYAQNAQEAVSVAHALLKLPR